jgi:hypothetical protein
MGEGKQQMVTEFKRAISNLYGIGNEEETKA